MTRHDATTIVQTGQGAASNPPGGARAGGSDPEVAALERVGPCSWLARFEPDWVAMGGIHGGLLVAVLLRAAAQATDRRPVTISAHFHAPVLPGAAELHAEVLRFGRSAASVSVMARQSRLCASALVMLEGSTHQSATSHPPLLGEPMPAAAPRDTDPLNPPPGIRLPFLAHVEIRPTGDGRPLGGGSQAALAAWIRPRRPIDDPVTRAAVLLDALAPSLFAIWREPRGVPTIELTMHLAPQTAITPWSAISQRTVWWNDVYCVDEADLRNEHGDLIAQARQRRVIVARAPGSAPPEVQSTS